MRCILLDEKHVWLAFPTSCPQLGVGEKVGCSRKERSHFTLVVSLQLFRLLGKRWWDICAPSCDSFRKQCRRLQASSALTSPSAGADLVVCPAHFQLPFWLQFMMSLNTCSVVSIVGKTFTTDRPRDWGSETEVQHAYMPMVSTATMPTIAVVEVQQNMLPDGTGTQPSSLTTGRVVGGGQTSKQLEVRKLVWTALPSILRRREGVWRLPLAVIVLWNVCRSMWLVVTN